MNFKSLLFILLFYVLPHQAFSCSCVSSQTLEEDIKQTDIIILGTVLDIKVIEYVDDSFLEISGDTVFFYYKEVTIQNKHIFKGKIKENRTIITTGMGLGDCGYNFKIGKEYVIFAYKKHNLFVVKKVKNFTSVCERTTEANPELVNRINMFIMDSIFRRFFRKYRFLRS